MSDNADGMTVQTLAELVEVVDTLSYAAKTAEEAGRPEVAEPLWDIVRRLASNVTP